MRTIGRVILGIACASIGIGIALVLVGFSFGGTSRRNQDNTYSYSDQVTGVTSIDLEVKFGDVEIVEGEVFGIEVYNTTEDGFESYVKDNVWYLVDKYDDKYSVNMLGYEVPIQWNGWNFSYEEESTLKVIVTVPKEFEAEEINVDLGAGKLFAKSLVTKEATFDLGAGKMELDRLSVSRFVSLDVGTGELKINELQAQDVFMNCGVGSINITGEILGDSEVKCGIGEIKLELEGDEDDYNYFIDCGIGSVRINHRTWNFSTSDTIRNKEIIGTFDMNCGIGAITLIFK